MQIKNFLWPLSISLTLLACSKESSKKSLGDQNPERDNTPGLVALIDAENLSYYRDIKPLIDIKCAACHSAGGLAGLDLNSYDQVLAKRTSIKAAVLSKQMPPWLAETGHQNYRDDLSLSPLELSKLVHWLDLGAKPGELSTYTKPAAKTGFQANATVPLFAEGGSFLPEQSSSDEYRCFIIPLDKQFDASNYITGFTAHAGNQKLTHHLVAYLAGPDLLGVLGELDAAEDGRGYRCFTGALPDRLGDPAVQQALEAQHPGITTKLKNEIYWLAHWAPGMDGGYSFPEGTGIKIPRGGAFVVQMHYYTESAKGETDQGTTFALSTAKTVNKPAFYYPLTNQQWLQSRDNLMMVIPAGQSASFTFDRNLSKIAAYGKRVLGLGDISVKNIEVHSANLHMHAIGASGQVSLGRIGQPAETLLHIPQWDLHWQRDFQFQAPKIISSSDWDQWQNTVSCDFTNTNPSDVFGGYGSRDEMCFNFGFFAFDLGN